MGILKCKMCGGNISLSPTESLYECEYCGTLQTAPSDDSEKKLSVFARANDLRLANEFDKSSVVYEYAIADFPDDPEGYWGLVLCEYGIEYVDDQKIGRKIPTCHRTSYTSIFDDPNYKIALSKADAIARRFYMEEAERIERIREEIISISNQEEPYDIFICYKDRDDFGERTSESVLAQEVYDELIECGYKVFFSRITLEDKLGINYEPYIFSALCSAKVMLVFASCIENVNSAWVKNEWQRYLGLIENDRSKTLIPCFQGMDISTFPKELVRFQGQDLTKVGAKQDLLHSIGKLLRPSESVSNWSDESYSESDALAERGVMALEDGDFSSAKAFFERALDSNPRNAQAHLGLFLVKNKKKALDSYAESIVDYSSSRDFQRAVKFANGDLAKRISEAEKINHDNLEMKEKGCVTIFADSAARRDFDLEGYQGPKYEEIPFGRSMEMSRYMLYANSVARILADRRPHNARDLFRYVGNARGGQHLSSKVLAELVEYGLIVPYPSETGKAEYCLSDAKAELERELARKRVEEKRRSIAERRYQKAYAQYERSVNEASQPVEEEILNSYLPQIEKIRVESGQEQARILREKTALQMKITSLQKQANELGFFSKSEKKQIQQRIDGLQVHLDALVNQEYEFKAKAQARIQTIQQERDEKISAAIAEIRSRHHIPKIEDYFT